ncbi:MAG: hypothetical protein WBW53_13980 [Terriglobales bacterium]
MRRSVRNWFAVLPLGVLIAVITWSTSSAAQDAVNRMPAASRQASAESSASVSELATDSLSDSIRQLREQVRELQVAVAGLRSDSERARSETTELRRELDQVRAETAQRKPELLEALSKPVVANPVTAGNALEALQTPAPNRAITNQTTGNDQNNQEDQRKSERVASLEEEYQLLSGKVDDQYQTKVESASKYRVRLSGIVLMNLFSNRGAVDSIDIPSVAYATPPGDSGGSFGATLRQSEIGFEVFGPTVAGAKTKADLQLDLGGGFAYAPNGVDFGLMRLRAGTMRMDWTNTSLVVGQDAIFFSPNSPTSFASLAIPALSESGNLWAWVPQIRVEHRVTLGDDSSVTFQGGILDPQAGEVPATASGSSYDRQAGPGEASRQPGYGTHMAWTRNVFGQQLRVGAGGYYSRQDYGFNRNVDGWAGMTDFELPLSPQFSLSGEFYRGRAIGGLYGAFGQSVLFNGDPTLAGTEVQPLNTIGGWAQLKYRPASKWEFNAAFGIDNPYASDLKYFQYPVSYGDATLARNRGSFVNMIYRPRSDLLFSVEYRRLTTYSLTDGGNSAGQLNLMMGVLF